MRWIETNLGPPVTFRDSDRPSRRIPEEVCASEQHAASDPEVHVQLDRVFCQLDSAIHLGS